MRRLILILALALYGAAAQAQTLDPAQFTFIRRVASLPATAAIGELYIRVTTLTSDPTLHIYTSTGFVELGQVDAATFTTLTVTTLTATTATITTLNTGVIQNAAADITISVDSGQLVGIGGGSAYPFQIVRGDEFTFFQSTTALAVVGASQNINPVSNVVHVSAGAAADVTTLTDPLGSQARNQATIVTLICDDANLTFTDTDAATANTMNLAGNLICSANDTLQLIYDVVVDKWFEVGRSVN